MKSFIDWFELYNARLLKEMDCHDDALLNHFDETRKKEMVNHVLNHLMYF